jgi:alanyl-tRNA synthetase
LTRLFDQDSHLRRFEATVVARREMSGAVWVALDRTAFYPGGGGQPPDRGSLGGLEVLEVMESEGAIWHRVEGSAPELGSAVVGTIDWARRFDHMQQHSGQHILSRAFVETARADTRSFHLGEAVITIDVDHPGPDLELLHRTEERANEIIWEDRAVDVRFLPRDEAMKLPLRKPPEVEGEVRVVEVRGYDWSACGGTHVARTGEVGIIAIVGTERYKGGTRVSFLAGGRVLQRLRESGEVLRRACLEFTAGEGDLLHAIGKLKEERGRLERRLKPLVRESLEREAEALLHEAPRSPHGPVVARAFEGREVEEGRALAAMIAARGGIAFLILDGETPRAHFSAPAGTIAVGQLLGEICRRRGGRGGGRPESAQGTIPRDQVRAALEDALQAAIAGVEKGTNR